MAQSLSIDDNAFADNFSEVPVTPTLTARQRRRKDRRPPVPEPLEGVPGGEVRVIPVQGTLDLIEPALPSSANGDDREGHAGAVFVCLVVGAALITSRPGG